MRPLLIMKKTVFLVLIGMISLSGILSAQDSSYDKYAPVYSSEASRTSSHNLLANLPVYPFEIVRYPIDKSLVAIEKYHMDTKTQWIYEWLDNHGVRPKIGILNPLSMKLGADFDLARIAHIKTSQPNAILNSWIYWAGQDFFKIGAQAGWERIHDTGFEVKSLINYEDRHRQHFYGIGPDTSRGDSGVYEREETVVQGSLGYAFDFIHKFEFTTAFHNVNISDGQDSGSGQFASTRVFNDVATPGLHGEPFFSFGPELSRDSRNQKENSTKGGLQRIGLSFNEGWHSSDARFFKYFLDGSQYFKLGSERRVIALRGYGEYNNELPNHIVPFHEMPRLGGHGTSPDLSYTLRGFDQNRFTDKGLALFNLEYRYTIWEYREWKADTILFWDEGQTFKKFSKFQMQDFRESYGIGFRVSLANIVVISTELAHGDEGTNLYVRSSAPF